MKGTRDATQPNRSNDLPTPFPANLTPYHMTGLLLLFLMLFTACGLVLSLATNVLSFTGDYVSLLFWGIFPTFLSVIIIGYCEKQKVMPGIPNDKIDHWGLVLNRCPLVLRWLFWTCFAYAFVIGSLFAAFGSNERTLSLRCVSAFCMAFYAMGLAVFTAAYLRCRAPRH